ncbi:MAG: ABC transporter ATP-binding protein [Alphaproteobacteria bacterium]|nr:ABC transporter ATP-binding protein [Alphaproteobacteria bacterium]
MTLLDARGVTKRFGGIVAVDNVSFSVERGEILGLMGANGAGKTTMFSLIAGNQRPDDGTIAFDGLPIHGMRPDQISRRGISRAFQIVRPFAGMTVLENVMAGALFGARRENSQAIAEARARDIIGQLGLSGRVDDFADSLTLASRKRLEIARALATNPQLLMLDEVMAGLTPTEVAEAVAMIRDLHRERSLTIVIIEHVMGVLMELCPRIVVLHHGGVLAEGAPKEISQNERVIEAYLGTGRDSAA